MTRPSTSSAGTAGPADLRRLCGGAVYLPGDARYDDARRPWNLRSDDRPAAVAYPAFPDEVAEVVRAASAAGLRIAFGQHDVHRVTAQLDARNTASERLAARVGMRQEAHHRQDFWSKGEWTDTLVFAVLADEHRAQGLDRQPDRPSPDPRRGADTGT